MSLRNRFDETGTGIGAAETTGLLKSTLTWGGPQRHAITAPEQGAFGIGAAGPVINREPVAEPKPGLSTQAPNCNLNVARKGLRKAGVERPSVDPLSRLLDDVGAASRPVTPRSIG